MEQWIGLRVLQACLQPKIAGPRAALIGIHFATQRAQT
jgi:hypothetical protein